MKASYSLITARGSGGSRGAGEQGSGVEGLHLLGELLQDDGPLEAELRRQVSTGLGEVGVEDQELADRLRLAHRLVRAVHRALDLGTYVGVRGGGMDVHRRLAAVRQPGRQHL